VVIGRFLFALLPGLLPSLWYDALKKALQAQGDVIAISIICNFNLPCSIVRVVHDG
jgi:hypothetical protein